jgi:hypothetical protein
MGPVSWPEQEELRKGAQAPCGGELGAVASGSAREGRPQLRQIPARDLPEATRNQPMMSSSRVTLKVIRSQHGCWLATRG